MGKDRTDGAGGQLSASVKEAIGKLIGDKATQAQGAAERTGAAAAKPTRGARAAAAKK